MKLFKYLLFNIALFSLTISCREKEELNPNINSNPLLKEVTSMNGWRYLFEYNNTNQIIKTSFFNEAKIQFYNTISYDQRNKIIEVIRFDSIGQQEVVYTPAYSSNGRFVALNQTTPTFGVFRIDSLFYNENVELVKIRSYTKENNTFVIDNEYHFTFENKNVKSWQFFTRGMDTLQEVAFENYEYDNKINPYSKISLVALLSFYNSIDPDFDLSNSISANNIVKSTSKNGEIGEMSFEYNEYGYPTKGSNKGTVGMQYFYK